MDALFRLEMLGRLSVWQANREITRFRTQKTAVLLAYLAFYRVRSHPRDVLIELLWPASDLEAGRTNLSVALNALRRQLEPPGVPSGSILITDRSQVRLNPLAFATDVEDFEKAAHDAELGTEANQRAALWGTAIRLYRGDLLPGFYEDWILAERDRLRDTYLAALRQIVKALAETHQHERAIEYAHQMVQADPLREVSYRNLMRLYMALGRPEDALYQYQELERLLQKELQTAPSTATRELAEPLRNTAPARRPAEKAPATDIPQKETTPDTKRPTLHLPIQFTRFFGQEEAMARLVEALSVRCPGLASEYVALDAQHSRLLTLTGPGGTGKTRLAMEVAWRVKEGFQESVWFVPLAELDDPRRLGEALRDALELPSQNDSPALDQVVAFLNGLGQPCLLILDNFEQVAGGASVVWTLLNRVPTLWCLVTSRRPLSLLGEQEIPVLPLPTPAMESSLPPQSLLPEHLLTYPGVALFVDRAQATRPEFQITPRNAEAIAALCAKLEGIPLAIELAAARARALTPAQILDRLEERFALLASWRADKQERHRSLWAAIDWSYHLLPPGLQRLFARLSVFRGGWSLEAAEAVCADFGLETSDSAESPPPEAGAIQNPKPKIENGQVLDYLSQLRGHSLILAVESSAAIRFRMLETLREFAAEQLTPGEQKEAERRHAVYFHRTVTNAQLVGSEQTAWFERFEEDLDNLRAVLAWSLHEGNEIEIGLQVAGTLISFWVARGHFSEGRRWYAGLLERTGDAPTVGLGQSLYGAGALASFQGDFQAALPPLGRCLEVAHALGDEVRMAAAHNELGSIALFQGDNEQARLHYEECLALTRAQGRHNRIAVVLGNLANVAHARGDLAASHALNEESLALWREAGDRLGEARTLHNLAKLAHVQGQLEEARASYAQSLEIKRELADRSGISNSLNGIAEVAIDQGDYSAAATYAREGLALARELNVQIYLVSFLYLLMELAWAVGELEIPARVSSALEKFREEMDYPMQPAHQEDYDRMQAELRESLGAAAYEAARTEGRELSLEQALACLEEMLASRSL